MGRWWGWGRGWEGGRRAGDGRPYLQGFEVSNEKWTSSCSGSLADGTSFREGFFRLTALRMVLVCCRAPSLGRGGGAA